MKMKYHLIIIAILAGFMFSCERDMSPEQADQFIKFYGDYLMDEARDMAALDDGGFAISGIASLPDVGTRMVLVVTDEFGNLKGGFPKYYPALDTVAEAGANTVVPIRGGQGGFLLAGYIERPVDGSLNTQKDIYLVKVSNAGAINWERTYGSVHDEEILHATEMISSGFVLSGYRKKEGQSDIMVMGVEQEGDSIPLGFREHPYLKYSSANYILNAGDRYLCVCTYDKLGSTTGATDIVALCFDDDFNPSPKYLSGDSNEEGTCVIEDEPNKFLVLGNRLNAARSEIVVYRIETDDNLQITSSEQRAKISESNADMVGNRIVKTEDGRYAIVGTRQSGNERQILLQFLSREGDPAESVLYGASGDQYGADIDIPDGGGLVMLGTTSYEENSMISLIKTNDTGDL